MKIFTKPLLMLFSLLILWLLWFSNAGWVPPVWDISHVEYDEKVSCSQYKCGINILGLLSQETLIWIWIILCIILFTLTVKAIILNIKFKDSQKNSCLVYIPILNFYYIFKITIWRFRFFCILLLVWFFCYSLYRDFNENRCCFHNPSRYTYVWIIVWILSIVMLLVSLSKLKKFYKNSFNKESSDK